MTQTEAQMGSFFRSILLESLPLVSVLILALLTTIPLGFPGTLRLGGLFPMIGIAYWTLVRPKYILPLTSFFLGLFTDIVTFAPIGMHAFVFVLLQSVLRRQRRFLVGQGFWVMWAAFALITISFGAMTCGFQVVFTGAFVPLRDLGLAGFIGWASVPLVLWALNGVHDLIDLFDEPIA